MSSTGTKQNGWWGVWQLHARHYCVSSTDTWRWEPLKKLDKIVSDWERYLHIFRRFSLRWSKRTNRLCGFHRRNPSSKSSPTRLSRATTWPISPKCSLASPGVVVISLDISCLRPTISISGAGEGDCSLRESSYLSQRVVVGLMTEPPLAAEDPLSPLLWR